MFGSIRKPPALRADVMAFAVKKRSTLTKVCQRAGFGVMLIDSCEGTSCEVLLYL